jgi:hypothetical protein
LRDAIADPCWRIEPQRFAVWESTTERPEAGAPAP